MAIPLRVLIVDDSENDTLLLIHELRRGDYAPTYERVDLLESMKAALDKQPWDLVLCDYTMPNFGGTDALLLLRDKDPNLPFIYVSGTIGEDMAVAASIMDTRRSRSSCRRLRSRRVSASCISLLMAGISPL